MRSAERGPVGAPTIVFIHGGGIPGWMWEPVVDQLPEFHILVPDLPGHGESQGQHWESIGATAALLAELIRGRATGGRAHVVGISLGGQLTLQLLATAPQLIDRAVVSGTLTRPMPAAGFLAWLTRVSLPWSRGDWMIRANAWGIGIPAQYLDRFRRTIAETDAAELGRVLTDSLRFQLPPIADGHDLLVAAGRKEAGLIYGSARHLAVTVPGVTLRMAPVGGHVWAIQTPDLFARMVRAWVNQEPLPAEMLSFPSGS